MQPNAEIQGDIRSSKKMQTLKAWLVTASHAGGDVDWGTDIIKEGVLDSLQMVNFLLYIEEVRGSEIEEEKIRPEHFASLQAIYRNFIADPKDEDGPVATGDDTGDRRDSLCGRDRTEARGLEVSTGKGVMQKGVEDDRS